MLFFLLLSRKYFNFYDFIVAGKRVRKFYCMGTYLLPLSFALMNALINGFKKLWEKPSQDFEVAESDFGAMPSSASVIDPLLLDPHMSFEGYLRCTSTCKELHTNRFGNLYKRVDFLYRLFRRALIQDGPTVVELLLGENGERERAERVCSVLKQFSKTAYNNELRLQFSRNECLNQGAFRSIAAKFQNIKVLKFAPEHIIHSTVFFAIVGQCQKLIHLEMPHRLTNYRDTGSKSVPQSVQFLKVSWNIVGRDLRLIVERGVNVESLSLSESLAKKKFFREVAFPVSLCRLNLDRTAIENESLYRITKQCQRLEWLSLCEPDRVTATGIRAAKFPKHVDIVFVPR